MHSVSLSSRRRRAVMLGFKRSCWNEKRELRDKEERENEFCYDSEAKQCSHISLRSDHSANVVKLFIMHIKKAICFTLSKTLLFSLKICMFRWNFIILFNYLLCRCLATTAVITFIYFRTFNKK